MLSELDAAFRKKDVAAIAEIAGSREEHAPRAYQLLGDLHRRERRFRDAVAAYAKAGDGNMSALYGLLECYKSLKDRAAFSEAAQKFLSLGRYNENLYSRALLAAAEIDDWAVAGEFAGAVDIENNGSEDPRTWFRCAKATLLRGDKPKAREYAAKARRLAEGNADLVLEIATIDYDLDEYWEMRYNSSQGERTPVPVSSQSDAGYNARTERDVTYLEDAFRRMFGRRIFDRVADCGCGSGRLTPFISRYARELSCYDISPTALEFAKRNNPDVRNATFETQNLGKVMLPEKFFDLSFDFTAVQHVSDPEIWEAVLRNYSQSVKNGGYLFLVQAIGDGKRKVVLHLSNATPEKYVETIIGFGGELVFKERTPWHEICLVFRF